jgi:hypothetical protein
LGDGQQHKEVSDSRVAQYGPQTAYSRTAVTAKNMTVFQTIGRGVNAIRFR